MSPESDIESWSTWRVHVLKELDRLSEICERLTEIISDFKERAFKVEELRSEQNTLAKEIERLKAFKIQAVTIWGIAQFLVLTLSAYLARH